MSQIVDSGNHYVIQVKRNQPKLWDGLQQVIGMEKPVDQYRVKEKAKGTEWEWHIRTFDISGYSFVKEWKNAQRLVCVGKTNDTTQEGSLRLFICDCASIEAEYYYHGIRGHWAIENQLHWQKDVYHKEDGNRIKDKNGSINCAVVSTMALNVHRSNERKRIKEAQMVSNAKIGQSIQEIRT